MPSDVNTIERKGTCPVCGHACHIIAHIQNEKIIRIKADEETLYGHVCPRGANTIDYHYHPER